MFRKDKLCNVPLCQDQLSQLCMCCCPSTLSWPPPRPSHHLPLNSRFILSPYLRADLGVCMVHSVQRHLIATHVEFPQIMSWIFHFLIRPDWRSNPNDSTRTLLEGSVLCSVEKYRIWSEYFQLRLEKYLLYQFFKSSPCEPLSY